MRSIKTKRNEINVVEFKLSIRENRQLFKVGAAGFDPQYQGFTSSHYI